MRRSVLLVLSFLVAAAFAAAASASARDSETITIGHKASVGGTVLAAGNYVVKWKNHSQDATITFLTLQGEQVVANAQGRLEKRNTTSERDTVVYDEAPDGSRTLVEIRFGGTNKALVLTPSTAASGSSKPGKVPTTKLMPRYVPGIGYVFDDFVLQDLFLQSNSPSSGQPSGRTPSRL